MRIETLKPDAPVYVTPSSENIELAIGEAPGGGRHLTTLSIPQAEMLVHALGIEIARIRERERREGEERSHLAEVLLDTEFRLHEH